MSLSAPALILPYEQSFQQDEEARKQMGLQQEAERVRMGGRLGSKISQLKDDNSPLNNNNPEARVNRNIPESIKPYASGFEEQKEVDNFGEEDLSYVSGDERDFNEQVQELNL